MRAENTNDGSEKDDGAELEGWAAIGCALGVTERTAQRYGRAKVLRNGCVRPALPARPNFRGMWAITPADLEAWKLEAARAQAGLAQDVTPEPPGKAAA